MSKTAQSQSVAPKGRPNKLTDKKSLAQKSRKALPLWIWLLAGVLILGATWWLTRQAGEANSEGLAREVNVQEAATLREAGAFVLDVREMSEWTAGHIPGATLIPLGELENRLVEVPKDVKILVVCRSGNRSAQGRDILLKAGYESVTSMAGGMNDWVAAVYPSVTGN